MATASSQSSYNEVQSIFIELFDRPAATAGYNYFGSQLATDSTTPTAVFGQISASTEAAGVTISSLFENLLGRAAGAPALAFFGGEMAAGQTIANIANQIYNDVLNESHTSQDYMVMTDKIDYANKYTGYLATNPSFTYNTPNAQAYINQVTPAGVMTGAITSAASSMPAVTSFVAGTTVDLVTTQTSYIEAASNGIVDFVVNPTYSSSGKATGITSVSSDILQAGAGYATLTYNLSNSSSASGQTADKDLPSASNMSGITTIQINNDGASDSVNVSGYASEGVKSLIINAPVYSSTSAQTYTIAGMQTITIENTTTTTQTINVSSSASASVNVIVDNAGKSSSVQTNINLKGSSSSAKVATVNLTANGTDYVALYNSGSYSDISTINITESSSSAKLSLGTNNSVGLDLSTLTSITANNAGSLTLELGSGTGSSSASFTFDGSKGSGQDTISLNAAPVSSSYTFTGGTNAHNTVDVNYAATASDLYSYLGTATNFQTLDFNASTAITNLSLILGSHGISTSFDNFVIDNPLTSADTLAFSGVTNSDTFNVTASAVGTLAISNASGSDTANIAFASSLATPVAITLAELNTDYASNAPGGNSNPLIVNIASNDGTKGAGNGITNIITALNVADGATVNLTGTDTYNTFTTTLSDGTTSPTLGVTFDAANFAGTLNITDGNNTNDTFMLGSGTSTVITGTGNDTITLGTASTAVDKITVNAVADTVAVSASSSSYTPTTQDVITNGSALNTDDKIVFNANLATNTVSLLSENTLISSATSLSDALSTVINHLQSADTNSTTTSTSLEGLAWFNYAGNTYIVNDVTTATSSTDSGWYDQVVKITGTVDLSHAAVGTISSTHLTVSNL
jgi:hypothetical protein